MSDNTSPTPASPAASTSVSFLDGLYLLGHSLKDMATNAAAAVVAKVKKWSPLAQTSVTFVIALGSAWLLLHWPSREAFETPATVDAKIANVKTELEAQIEKQHKALTLDFSKLPSADDIAKGTAGKAEFMKVQTAVENFQARLKKLEAEVAALSSRASHKRRSR